MPQIKYKFHTPVLPLYTVSHQTKAVVFHIIQTQKENSKQTQVLRPFCSILYCNF